jgi:uncharacterized membrane protein
MVRALELTLVVPLLFATLLLMAGLALGAELLLRSGILLLMFTPVAREVVVTVGFFHVRDWRFAAVSTLVLAVLASGMLVAARL